MAENGHGCKRSGPSHAIKCEAENPLKLSFAAPSLGCPHPTGPMSSSGRLRTIDISEALWSNLCVYAAGTFIRMSRGPGYVSLPSLCIYLI